MKTMFCVRIPIRTISESNISEHWTKKQKRHKLQKTCVKYYLKNKPKLSLPLKVVLTRIAPNKLDEHDNLRMSFKWIADAIADSLIPGKKDGRADDSKEISWEYKQEKGNAREYAIKIEIQKVEYDYKD